MKLAEALLLRSEYQKKFENLRGRIKANLKAQDGEKPNENPHELLSEAFAVSQQLNDLIKKINKRNNQILLSERYCIADALTDRDMIMKKRDLLAGLAADVNEKEYRLTRSEIKIYVTLPVSDIQKQIDELSGSFRELDARIQALNWITELEPVD